MELNQSMIMTELTEPLANRAEELIEILNSNIKPDNKLSEKDIHIRAMYIVSEEINSYGGQFQLDEMSIL